MLSTRFSITVLLGAILYYWVNSNVTYVTLDTKFGSIKGVVSKSRTGREYYSFYALPYALPPVDERRFQSPVPFGSWTGLRDATKMGPICPQYDILWQKLDGQEDCLYLNVFTPKESSASKELLPVMVFIHGGHFMYGGSDIYGPQYFMDEDVVIVTLNYRLGALGFLNTGPEARGNMGLKDQALALKWIQETIKSFGGNPKSVTIMGESAGGASVNYHMISPYSDGLFHRAISQSGTALCPWAFMTNTHEQGKRLAKRVGCPIGTTESMMKCLKEIDVMKIIEPQAEMKEVFSAHDVAYVPSIDYTSQSSDEDDVFLYDSPRDAHEDGQMVRVPWMLGVVPQEGCFRSALIFTNETLLNELNHHWNKIAPATFMYEKDDIVSAQIKNHYFGKAKNQFTHADYEQVTRIYSDRYFFQGIHTAATHHSKVAPTYLYDITYKTGMSIAQARVAAKGRFPIILEIIADFLKFKVYEFLGYEVPDYGICHADDLQYLFYTISLWEISPRSSHYAFSRDLVKLWVSFASTGSPTKFQNVAWEKVNPNGDLKYFELGTDPKMIVDPFSKGVEFWKSLHV